MTMMRCKEEIVRFPQVVEIGAMVRVQHILDYSYCSPSSCTLARSRRPSQCAHDRGNWHRHRQRHEPIGSLRCGVICHGRRQSSAAFFSTRCENLRSWASDLQLTTIHAPFRIRWRVRVVEGISEVIEMIDRLQPLIAVVVTISVQQRRVPQVPAQASDGIHKQQES